MMRTSRPIYGAALVLAGLGVVVGTAYLSLGEIAQGLALLLLPSLGLFSEGYAASYLRRRARR
jgi:phosphoribosylaminoimidazole (AIR) synthetase